MDALPDIDKLNRFNNLLGVIEENVKNESIGRAGNSGKERKGIKDVVSLILGRSPTPDELRVFPAFQ